MVGILVGDLHLSHTPPLMRSVEEDWYAVQKRYLSQLAELSYYGRVPIVCAGDILDRWQSPPELLNFLLKFLPYMYCVPGNHDLPHHSYEDIHRSGYWTLAEAGRIKNLELGKPEQVGRLLLHGFPEGTEVVKPSKENIDPIGLKVAVVHKYLRTKKTGYPGAPNESLVGLYLTGKRVAGYDCVLIGDNHRTFHFRPPLGIGSKKRPITVFNPGTFMRRKLDELDHRPVAGLLLETGEVKKHYLDISQDKTLDVKDDLDKSGVGMDEVVEVLDELYSGALPDFLQALEQYFGKEGISPKVKKLILRAMERSR